jgi:hypothetical protein
MMNKITLTVLRNGGAMTPANDKRLISNLVSQNFVKFDNLFRYDEETGQLFWKVRGRGRQLNRPAGNYNDQGYRIVMIEYKNYRASRIIWLLKTGYWPKNEIDHIDRNRKNNRFENLRDVTRSENAFNGSPHYDSKSRLKGVSQARSGRWIARRGGKNLGTFDNEYEAAKAYDLAGEICAA